MLLRGLRALQISIRTCHVPAVSQQKPQSWDDILTELEKANEPEKPLTAPQSASEMDEIAPYLAPTFNLAAYANKSPSIKKFLELGVDLYKIEKRKGLGQFVLQLDFERDCKNHLMFLNDIGVQPEAFGEFITKNPLIFKETVDDLSTRVNYLKSKNFKPDMITRIVTVNPFWLSFTTKRIDKRLGYFQKDFELRGHQVRLLSCRQPKVITYNMEHIEKAKFSIKEQMGFEKDEVRRLVLSKPKILMMNHDELFNRFDYIHKKMKVSHRDIVKSPELLLTRQFKLKQRHEFLELRGRNQYDPTKELYVSLADLVTSSDRVFVESLAKSNMKEYTEYLKSL